MYCVFCVECWTHDVSLTIKDRLICSKDDEVCFFFVIVVYFTHNMSIPSVDSKIEDHFFASFLLCMFGMQHFVKCDGNFFNVFVIAFDSRIQYSTKYLYRDMIACQKWKIFTIQYLLLHINNNEKHTTTPPTNNRFVYNCSWDFKEQKRQK